MRVASPIANGDNEGGIDFKGTVLVWQWGHFGGAPRFAAELAGALQRENTNVVLSLSHHAESYETLSTFSRRLRPFAGRGKGRSGVRVLLSLPVQLFGLYRNLRNDRPDVAIGVMIGYWDLLFVVLLRLMGVRVVGLVHEVEGHSGDIHQAIYLLQQLFVFLCHGIIVLSRHVGAEAARRWPNKPLCIASHPPFTFADLDPSPPQALVPERQPLKVLVAGRMWAYKGLALALDAVRRLPRGHATLRIAGRGAALEQAGSPAGDVVVVDRWLSEMELLEEIDRTDLVLFPYLDASQSGLVPLALSRGRPAIVTPVGGLPEQVHDQEDGIVADASTPDALAAAISQFVGDREMLSEMSKAAISANDPLLLWQEFVVELLDILAV